MMNEFKPTWLYIKTHNITGLNYLGKTGRKDPVKYKGSGTYWNLHLNKHGADFSTFIIGYYTEEEECKRMAVFYSWFFDIVDSKDWANLKHETLDGGAYPHSEETKQRLREFALARVAARTHPLLKRADGTSVAQESILSRIESRTFVNPGSKREDGTCISSDRVTARTHNLLKREDGTSISLDQVVAGTCSLLSENRVKKECPGCHEVVDLSTFVRLHGDRCGKPLPKKECPYCHQWISFGNFSRWHGDRCKMKLHENLTLSKE